MEIIYTFYAALRVKERKIMKKEVEECIKNPDKIKHNFAIKAIKKVNANVLIVVYKIFSGKIFGRLSLFCLPLGNNKPG